MTLPDLAALTCQLVKTVAFHKERMTWYLGQFNRLATSEALTSYTAQQRFYQRLLTIHFTALCESERLLIELQQLAENARRRAGEWQIFDNEHFPGDTPDLITSPANGL
jgi:hypothetical protein